MMKYLAYLFCFFIQLPVLACPYCSGSENSRDKYTYIILGIFILLTYIPLSVLFKTARKYGKKYAGDK